MIGLRRKLGSFGLLLSLGVACTQLFGDRKDTLAPLSPPKLPATISAPMFQQPAPAEAVCTAGEMRCEGALLQTCADDQTSWVTVQRCAAAKLCQLNPATCLAATCEVDEMTCSGSVLQKCNADRTDWDLFATCLSPAHCNADLRQCMPEPCNAGDRRCDRSETDQSPVLELCRDDRQDWASLDACVTRALCEQTLASAGAGGLVVGSDGMLQLQAPTAPSAVSQCNLPACAPGETRCEGAQLEFCAEGRTGWTVAEDCASPALCNASLTNVGSSGTPQCLPPVCAVNEHQCSEGGVLQVCSEDRSGFRVIQACIGPPFCNAVLADQGQEGCRSAPCEAGQMQCNGAQIQVCRADRTGLDASGPACESAALCNADDPTNAFCEEPACRRGPTSGNEFRCEAAQLERCNESLTGYDTVQTCVTAGLCDASQRFNGCRPPVCQPNQHVCSDGFLQTCNADQTGFESTENCGSQAQCDANAGRCADPCEPGSVRCNSQSGDLEECRDLLTGWQTIADCLSLQLCDADNRRCNPPVCAAGTRRCETRGQNAVISECAAGREGFNVTRTCAAGQLCDAQNNECDVCTANSVSCEGDTLVTCDSRGQTQSRQACGAGLCSAAQRRCLACGPPGSARCTNQQLLVCTQSPQAEFESSEFCDTDALCAQTLSSCGRGLNGQSCQCNDGACRPNQVACNNGQVQRCNTGLTGFDTLRTCAAPELCNAATADCNTCVGSQFSCNNGQLRQCAADGRSFARQNISLECASNTQLRVCNGNTAGVQNCPNGCTTGRGCNECTGNAAQCVNNQVRRCVNGFFQIDNCNNLGCSTSTNTCNNCNVATCTGNSQFRACNGGQLGSPTNCPQQGQVCQGNGNCVFDCQRLGCDDQNLCTTDSCTAAAGCVHTNNTASCSDGNPCNGNETCRGGSCQPGTAFACNDGNPCTTDDNRNCNPATGQCTFPRAPEGMNCGGGNTCQAGQCRAPAPPPAQPPPAQPPPAQPPPAQPPPAQPPPPAQVCASDQTRCMGTTPQRCRADRTAFENIPPCSGAVITACLNGAVITQDCDDKNECTAESCVVGADNRTGFCNGGPRPLGTPCKRSDGSSGVCGNADAVCQECNVTGDCSGGSVCRLNACAPPLQ